ncbi:hypothetical protein BZL30_2458 [Mycobacterium kansasii]|uniref:Uncharacterized protein n=1 Tax=Mycobacterium kansasii TaxID=1768 RepID=A0A1V3XHV5_MYCKA|nr:hypothetical protein BZL30_2458 [Mycobacterium kansasii]
MENPPQWRGLTSVNGFSYRRNHRLTAGSAIRSRASMPMVCLSLP